MSGPVIEATGWDVSVDGDGGVLRLDRNGWLLARLRLDRDALVALAEDLQDVASRLDWAAAAFLTTRDLGGRTHLLRNVGGWQSGRTLCGRAPRSWSIGWHGWPLLAELTGSPAVCSICARIWRRETPT